MKSRPCKEPDCRYPAAPRRQRCVWHHLARAASTVQAVAARERLASTSTEARRSRVPAVEWPDGERWCSGCQSFVPLFYVSGSRCRACASIARHASSVEKVYGITIEQYDELLALQGGRCAICRQRAVSKRLAVDHDHASGAVRGLLCSRCNHDLLGAAHDDVRYLWAALHYLMAAPATGQWQAPEAWIERAAGVQPRAREVRPAVDDEPPY